MSEYFIGNEGRCAAKFLGGFLKAAFADGIFRNNTGAGRKPRRAVIFNGAAYACPYNLQGNVMRLFDSRRARMVSYTYAARSRMLTGRVHSKYRICLKATGYIKRK